MSSDPRAASRFAAPAALALLLTCALAAPDAGAQTARSVIGRFQTELDGHVVEAQSGLPVAGVTVSIVGIPISAVTDRDGNFRILNLPPGSYALRLARTGYEASDADTVAIAAGSVASVVLSLDSAATAALLETLGHTATTPGSALEKSATTSRSLDPNALIASGTFRVGDALRGLPFINNGYPGDTAALGDDLQLDFRGIGTLESLATLDGHPIAYGVPGGYNYALSPLAGLQNIDITYGSGTNLAGYSAIGGTVGMRTLDPSPEGRVALTQGYGQYNRASTQLRLTGTVERLGYAFAYGVSSLDGPLKDDYQYQPGAAFDQSAIGPGADPTVRDLAVYEDDSRAVSRSGLAKLRFALSATSSITFTSLVSAAWNDKTGNGDADFTTYPLALAQGQSDLAGYEPAAFPHVPICPAGTFVATNANGQPNGYGPPPKGSAPGTLGPRDGGITCQTPQQYAAFNTGYAGTGTAWQNFNFGDYHLGLVSRPHDVQLRADVFTNRYLDTISRLDSLPFVDGPGTSERAFYASTGVQETGANVNETLLGADNDIGLGLSYLNTGDDLHYSAPAEIANGTPRMYEDGIVLHDSFHPAGGPLRAFFDGTLKHASATDSTSVNPRLSLAYAGSNGTSARLSAGATTTQPGGNALGQPFVPAPPGGAAGTPINCSANAVGSAPSSILKPERGVDIELAVGHRFGGDSNVGLTLYNVNVYDKLFRTSIPLSQAGTGFIDPAYLAAATAAIAAVCGGTANAFATEQVTQTFNVARERARGALIAGRERLGRRTFIDYDWTLDSTALLSAPTQLLQANVTLVPGAQLARLPLHTFTGALDHVIGRSVDLRYTVHTFSAGNTKALPAYDYSDLQASVPIGSGLFTLTVSNLFNQWGSIVGQRNAGIPLALNAYATPAAYTPSIGAAATEQFGLPYRTIFFNYSLFTH